MPGSSTVSTRTSCLPCQVSARIGLSFLLGKDRRIARRRRDFAGFEQLFKAPQVAPGLDRRFALKEFGDQLSQDAARRLIRDCCSYDGAARAGFRKSYPPTVGDISAVFGLPSEGLSFDLIGNPGIPFVAAVSRSLYNPVRALVVEHIDTLDILHELRQLCEVPEESVELAGRAIDG